MKIGLYIDGKFEEAEETYELTNPYNDEVIAEVAEGQTKDMEKAIASAQEAFLTMKKMPAVERANILFAAARLLAEKKEEFAKLITAESGKPISASRAEVDRSVQTLQFSGEEAKKIAGEYIPLDAAVGGGGRDAYTIFEPIGVIGAVTPFNFPLNLVVHKVGPAIASGNAIVVKPAEKTPLTSLKLAELFTKVGLPDGVLNVVPGDGATLVGVMLEDTRVQKISFTGSPRVGTEIKSKSGLKRITLELGSNSALYVDDSVEGHLEEIVDKAIAGAFSYNGQVCIHTQRIYVHERISEKFLARFVDKTKRLKFGDPMDEDTVVTGMIDKKSQSRVLEWVKEAVEGGAKLLSGGERRDNGVLPTVLTDVKPTEKVACEEVFGPVVMINKVSDSDEALRHMNDSQYGLNAGVFTNNLKQAFHFAHELEVGQVLINDVPTLRFDNMPYGGIKSSGYGHEGVKYAVKEMTRMKMISINFK
ncbi:aldehyde dehydrogenase family protein [Lederbergia wuyishanensis]|uniref:Acyl-CoA reductase-like NAD-dependent aldehyde dehydrogenase n=1 Tax=Lederbergia wuyishanensis TaxID=1347903 RepID=A0ABU0D7H2_9BACI|nr:aldehyde dehydrogenase family protein [Lederbergia wuyishanensis]MCJ8009029.1 aldehyde dehydrogenase family protein [Lederbergia wuyishanensis]MDQ0344361.1 acyl-CoA reductase-like NAD-dependent aldehyde dehydrogenase [Lederbergia wuyishanensis]